MRKTVRRIHGKVGGDDEQIALNPEEDFGVLWLATARSSHSEGRNGFVDISDCIYQFVLFGDPSAVQHSGAAGVPVLV